MVGWECQTNPREASGLDPEAVHESIFEFHVRGRTDTAAFLDMGDQFLALMETADETSDAETAADDHRHIGLVVDDRDAVERGLDAHGVETLPTNGLDFHDPWGNRIQIVAYEDIQFTKADHVRHGMGLTDLEKSSAAVAELAEKGMAPDE